MKKLKLNSEFFKFCIVGGFSFIIDYSMLFVCTEYLHFGYLLSAGIAFSIAVLINYILCAKYVFCTAKQNLSTLIGFLAVSCIGLLINQLCMWGLVEIVLVHYLAAKIVATIVVILWNFFTKRYMLT